MIRLFIALEIPVKIISALLFERDKLLSSEKLIRWEQKEKLHITLKFLGDTEETLINNISAELENIVNRYEPIKLEVSKFGVFRKGKEPKILWIGMRENYHLSKFVEEIEKSFCKFGYPIEEKKFKPHITLFRFRGCKDDAKVLSLLEVKLPALCFEADKISLIKSELKQTGSVYSSIKNFRLENKGRCYGSR
ncbi:MAG: RNA 2',3'-cyclic phosphodiesterase [Bacteroidota bacterium]